ncbi:hypothetical protein Moror_6315 [Moniliophthora roreri MCA 2997]|uniref:Duf803 domain membrane protein n=1 Tax=Moniliophthora roreri (strain MCA 2997) TaxID=1381753 RepID=V2YZF4_MONRO|nr:hypothetical protein Moror_6315 [Moniliophthora roreri MCA 2997]KAI3618888.1 hypothetical protein WG66_000648 [Moniliophthora roreri]
MDGHSWFIASRTSPKDTFFYSRDAESDPVPAHHASPVVSFIIGLAIVILASILNAAGLNLTKLDHVRTSTIPKASRRKDWLRPLWLLGMLLYILSQLIGSTLALEYMRAEYVAPLGSTSLVFNFLFARFLVGTPVTSNDIYGTIVVVLGVVGIVAFGSINSGLASETDVMHLTYLWRRSGWLLYFFIISFALLLVLLFIYKLDAVLTARSDISAVPFAGYPTSARGESKSPIGVFGKMKCTWNSISNKISQWLEAWTAPKDDRTLAWTLGIGWGSCGGGLAGGTLVFAKATVKLLSGSLSHENPGNQFGHAAPIFTVILLAFTAVLQIVCLNRGLKVYDSTLVVPVFYGVYTATGFLNSLIFNDEVDAYKSWTLFLIFVSILVLISGVVLLTHKKPEPSALKPVALNPPGALPMNRTRTSKKESENEGRTHVDGGEGEEDVLWAVGDAESDGEGEDEDIDHHQHPLGMSTDPARRGSNTRVVAHGEEGRGLMSDDEDGDVEEGRGHHTGKHRDSDEEFGSWTDAGRST